MHSHADGKISLFYGENFQVWEMEIREMGQINEKLLR
jgi:hypothetical protein